MNRARIALVAVAACFAAVLPAPPAAAAEAWEAVGAPIDTGQASPADFDLKRIDGAPTIAYAHWNGTNREIRVVRYSGGKWRRLGTRVNADPAHEATRPSLAAGPGGIPWVAWIEEDSDGITQIRAARYSASEDRFVEPVGGDWPIQSRPHPEMGGYDYKYFRGVRAQIAFVGSRAHVLYVADNPSELVIGIKRLSLDRRSWRGVSAPRRFAPSSFRGTVIEGVLHTAFSSRLGGEARVDRLGPNGWEQLGAGLSEVAGEFYESSISGLAGVGGVPHAAWNPCCGETPGGQVARFVDGRWQNIGGGLGDAGAGTLRFIGGRLWVTAWHDGLFALRLAEDESDWLPTPVIEAQSGGGLTGIDGVPHTAWRNAEGQILVSRLTGVAPAGPDDNDGTASPCAVADAEIAASVTAPPPPAPWPPADPADSADASCPSTRPEPPGEGPGGNPGHGNPGAGNPGPGNPNPSAPVSYQPGPCGPRLLGTARADTLTGDAARNEIAGRAGADKISGLGGDDCLFGNAGNDVIKGGAGADRIEGGSGRDRIVSGAGNDRVSAGSGNDVVDSRGSGFDVIDCGPGRDRALVGDLDRVRNCERVVNMD
ncbi:MAG TPA: calcium-binding protein [Thermoleophilaceae bacterium]|jgi:hypothetical protein